jgi:photosystem II stability/assembly factor-like uncharacterized protein
MNPLNLLNSLGRHPEPAKDLARRVYALNKQRRPERGARAVLLIFLVAIVAATISAQSVPPELFNGLKWRLIGPFRGGRAVAVAGVPSDPTTFYFGAVDGGIWKTTDAGTVWNPIFDNQPVASIGAIAVAPSDPKTIYAGTGEPDIRSDLASGNGVYKSSNGGQTWTHVGLDETQQISRIVVDPRDANTVYVGALGHAYGPNAERGVFKSTDGGAHWTKVLDQGADTGISDLAICAGNSQILFAGTWRTHRVPWSAYAPVDGPGGGLYRSQDAGKTWSRLSSKEFPEGDWGRIGVDVGPDGKHVYALIQAKKPGLYRSDDGGDTWTLANADPRLTSRAWYFNSITIDPENPNVIYIPNVALYRSEDGGKTISVLRGAPGGDDYHQIWIDPKNSSRMVLGTDQGTSISVDRGQTWSTWYNQPTAQLYHVITDNQFPYNVYGPQQDSGAIAVPSRTNFGQITPRDWFPAGPSESGYIVLDPVDPDIIYISGAYGSVARYDRRTALSQDVSPWPVPTFGTDIDKLKFRAPWAPVLASSPLDPKAIYFGSQYVMKTVDGGLHWETLSPDLTRESTPPASPQKELLKTPTNAEAKNQGYGVISTIAPSPLNPDLIWAGSDTGLIHLTRDGGKAWQNVTPPDNLSDWSEISLIDASHFNPEVAYAAVDRSRLDDRKPYIYRTRDYGETWQLISNGISDSHFVRAIREDPQTEGLLYAGTEFGIYVSFDDGDHWQSLQLNLPITSIRDLTIHGDDLIVATHGRSFWILDDIAPLRQLPQAQKAKSSWLYQPATATRIDNDDFVGTPLPPEEPTAENPPNGAIIDYVLKSTATSVTLEILDSANNVVRKFTSEDTQPAHAPLPVAEQWFPKPEAVGKTRGMHRFEWDLTWKSSGGPVADDDAVSQNPTGPKIVPGTYQVRLTVDGATQMQTLHVSMDPRSSASPEVLAEQFKWGRQIFDDTVQSRRALAEINSVQKQLAEILQKVGASPSQLQSALTNAQLAMTNTLAAKENSGALGLEEANKELASALRVVEYGERSVPSQAIAVYQQSAQQAKSRVAEWTTFKQTTLSEMNRKLDEAKLPTISISEITQEVDLLVSR